MLCSLTANDATYQWCCITQILSDRRERNVDISVVVTQQWKRLCCYCHILLSQTLSLSHNKCKPIYVLWHNNGCHSDNNTGKGSVEHANKFKQWLLEDNYAHYCENTVLLNDYLSTTTSLLPCFPPWTRPRNQKGRPILPLPHNTHSVGIGVISIGNGSTKQWNN